MANIKKIYQFPVVIEKDADGVFMADCPDLQGCHTQGKTIEEAITNIRDAIELHIKILKEVFINRKVNASLVPKHC